MYLQKKPLYENTMKIDSLHTTNSKILQCVLNCFLPFGQDISKVKCTVWSACKTRKRTHSFSVNQYFESMSSSTSTIQVLPGIIKSHTSICHSICVYSKYISFPHNETQRWAWARRAKWFPSPPALWHSRLKEFERGRIILSLPSSAFHKCTQPAARAIWDPDLLPAAFCHNEAMRQKCVLGSTGLFMRSTCNENVHTYFKT